MLLILYAREPFHSLYDLSAVFTDIRRFERVEGWDCLEQKSAEICVHLWTTNRLVHRLSYKCIVGAGDLGWFRQPLRVSVRFFPGENRVLTHCG